jgi:hypothetical protein
LSEDYDNLVEDLKALDGCPFAENGWETRPKSDSWGVVTLEYEAGTLHGDNLKQARAFEGSIDLFSKRKNGEGYPEDIEEILTEDCEGCWTLNSFQWEQGNGIFHWEWVFQVEG